MKLFSFTYCRRKWCWIVWTFDALQNFLRKTNLSSLYSQSYKIISDISQIFFHRNVSRSSQNSIQHLIVFKRKILIFPRKQNLGKYETNTVWLQKRKVCSLTVMECGHTNIWDIICIFNRVLMSSLINVTVSHICSRCHCMMAPVLLIVQHWKLKTRMKTIVWTDRFGTQWTWLTKREGEPRESVKVCSYPGRKNIWLIGQ